MLERGVVYDIRLAKYGQTSVSYAVLEVAFLKPSCPRHDHNLKVTSDLLHISGRKQTTIAQEQPF